MQTTKMFYKSEDNQVQTSRHSWFSSQVDKRKFFLCCHKIQFKKYVEIGMGLFSIFLLFEKILAV